MLIKIGGKFGEPEKIIDASSVEVLSSEDPTRAMFSLHAGRDCTSLEVSAGGMFKAGGVVYEGRLAVHPNASNSVTIRATKYAD